MKRRQFLQNAGLVSAGHILLNGLPVRAMGNADKLLSGAFTCTEIADRVLVLVNLFGANDGLNTVIPIAQYSTYATNRPTLKIAQTGTGAYINLDTTLPLNRQVGLNPGLTAFKALYDQGKLNVVNGVGYPSFNRSHFRSDDLWNYGGDGTSGNTTSGWGGDLMNYRFPNTIGNPTTLMPDPLGIELGATSPSLLFETPAKTAGVLLLKNDLSNYYTELASLGGPLPNPLPGGEYGGEIKYIADVEKLSSTYANRIQTTFNAGSNSTVVYNANSSLANQLKTVARLVKGGCKTRIFLVHKSGFDTHANQAVAGATGTGTHANLLKDVADSIKAFQDDLALLGLEDRVITATYSEFGRTIDQNASLGTDHGGVNNIFIIGKGVQPGMTGNPVDLTKVDQRALVDLQFDYRRVWAGILQDFMAHNNTALTTARLGAFAATKAPVISTAYKAPASCYIGQQTTAPATFVNVDAKLQSDGTVLLQFVTGQEVGTDKYEIEYSENGAAFAKLGAVRAAGVAAVEHKYSYLHEAPATGNNWYRVVPVEKSGTKATPAQAQLFIKDADGGFTAKNYPNPAAFDFNISVTAKKEQLMTLQVFDVQGHLLRTQRHRINEGFTKINMLTAGLKAGTYILQLKSTLGFDTTLQQVIKN